MSDPGAPPPPEPGDTWQPPPRPPEQPPDWGMPPPPPPPPPGYAPPPPPGYGQQPYGQYGYGYAPPKQEGTAVAALVCAIGSWVVCPVVLAIVGLVLASSAKQKIEASGGTLTGEGLVTAAKWVSWINIGLYGIGIVFLIIIVIIAAATSDTSNDFSAVLSLVR